MKYSIVEQLRQTIRSVTINMTLLVKSLFAAFALVSLTAQAQQPGMSFGGRGDRVDRGGDRGDRGGFGGGGFGGGSFGGGSFGGPPGGGFGGPPGGGGFDPSSFLTRMDTNGNGMLDPEEAQGPARFMLDRMARNNPKIDITKPIPMSVLTESFQQMRSGGPGSDGRGFVSAEEEIPILEKNSLVPGFGSPAKTEKAGVPGFGASGEKFNVQIDERDLKDADERIGRYDKNSDKQLDENELKEGRWSDSPMQYDKNQDGKLTRQELAVRYARRRLASPTQPDPRKEDANAKRAREAKELADNKKATPNPFEKRASYRLTDAEGKAPAPAGLPEWFTRNDINTDNQVSMAEFAKKWSAEAIEDFSRFDSNGDGFVTSKECLVAVKKGYIPGAASSPASAMTSTAAAPSSSSITPAASAAVPGVAIRSSTSSTDNDMRLWAEKKLKSIDKDGNGFLSPNEYSGDFAKVDTNKDGKIDLDEYAASRKR